jgi:hypothetical protein
VNPQQLGCFSNVQKWLKINLDNAAPKARCHCPVIHFPSVRQFGQALGFPFFILCGSVLVSLKRATGVFVKKRCESIRLGQSIIRAEARDMSSCRRCVPAHVELGLSDFHAFTQTASVRLPPIRDCFRC